MKTYAGVEVQSHPFLTSALGCEWSVARAGSFIPEERARRTIRKGCRVGPRASMYAMTKRKIAVYAQNRTTVVQPIV